MFSTEQVATVLLLNVICYLKALKRQVCRTSDGSKSSHPASLQYLHVRAHYSTFLLASRSVVQLLFAHSSDSLVL